jgi:hypothetical protein
MAMDIRQAFLRNPEKAQLMVLWHSITIRLEFQSRGDLTAVSESLDVPLQCGIQLLVPFPELRVIFISGYSRDRDERTANLSQASYLQKPHGPRRLGRLVRDILDCETKPTSS